MSVRQSFLKSWVLGQKQFFSNNKFYVRNVIGPKKIVIKRILHPKRNLSQKKIVGQKNFVSIKILGPKHFGSKKILGPRNVLGPKKCLGLLGLEPFQKFGMDGYYDKFW